MRTSTKGLWIVGLATLVLMVPAPAADSQAESPPTAADAPAPPPTEPPVTADLTEVRELVRAKRYEEAERLAAELQVGHPDDPALLTLRGELLLALGRAGEAVDPLRRAAALAPGRQRVHFQLGTALATTGELEGALDAFAKELAISDDKEVLVLARLNRSLLFERRGAPVDAARELEAALEVDPSRAPIYGDLVTLYLELDRVDDAVAALSRGAEAAGFASARHWFSVGARLVQDGKDEPSISLLQRAVELDPNLAEAERTLGVALDHLGRRTEAAEHFRRYVDLAPTAGDAGAVRARIGELEKAR